MTTNKRILSGPQKLLRVAIPQVIQEGLNAGGIGTGEESSIYERPYIPERESKPKVLLYFLEHPDKVRKGYKAIEGELSFRLMDKTSQSITSNDVQTLAEKIKSKFATPPFLWKKGKDTLVYNDPFKGYQLKIFCRDELDGLTIARELLEIQGDSLDLKKADYKRNLDPLSRYEETPGSITILNKTYRRRRYRPITEVLFQYAYLHLWGVPSVINLIDLTGKRLNPVLSQR